MMIAAALFLLFPQGSPLRLPSIEDLSDGKVLVIGINDYVHPGIDDLEGPEADALAVRDVLCERYSYEAVDPVLGAAATREGILGAINAFLASGNSRTTLIIFLAGHGRKKVIQEGHLSNYAFFIPVDYPAGLLEEQSLEELQRGAIDMRYELQAMINEPRLKARHIILFLDSCFSGFAAERGYSPSVLASINSRPSRFVLTASSKDQKALEAEMNLGEGVHGLFTASLLNALEPDPPRAQTLTAIFDQTLYGIYERCEWLNQPGAMSPRFMPLPPKDGGMPIFLPKGLAEPRKEIQMMAERFSVTVSARGKSAITSADLSVIRFVARCRSEENAATDPLLSEYWRHIFQVVREQAGRGNPQAETALFYCYLRGLGVRQDLEMAATWGVEASERNPDAEVETTSDLIEGELGSFLVEQVGGWEEEYMDRMGLGEILHEFSFLSVFADEQDPGNQPDDDRSVKLPQPLGPDQHIAAKLKAAKRAVKNKDFGGAKKLVREARQIWEKSGIPLDAMLFPQACVQAGAFETQLRYLRAKKGPLRQRANNGSLQGVKTAQELFVELLKSLELPEPLESRFPVK